MWYDWYSKKTEETEFRNIYGMDVVEIPTNRPVIRIDHHDVVYRTEAAKFRAVVKTSLLVMKTSACIGRYNYNR